MSTPPSPVNPRRRKLDIERDKARPLTLAVQPESIPADLRSWNQWVLWRWTWVEEKDGKPGRWTKVPHDPRTGRNASSTEPSTWAPFAVALAAYQKGGWDGIGYVFSIDDPFAGIDLDDCYDEETGQVDEWASDLLGALNSYTDLSPTSTGCKVFVRGRKPGERCKKKYAGGEVEVYDRGRFFTVTGWRLDSSPVVVADRQEALERLYALVFSSAAAEATAPASEPEAMSGSSENNDVAAILEEISEFDAAFAPSIFRMRASGGKLDDEGVIRAAMACPENGAKFTRLWKGDTSDYDGDDSRADLGCCNYLRFWTGKDRVQVERLFRRSGLMRPKWDERRGQKTYGQMTIAKAMQGDGLGDDSRHAGGSSNQAGAQATGEKVDPALWEQVLKTATLGDVAHDGATIEWRWKGWLQVGCLVGVVSNAGVGKTRLAADLARRIRHGLPWPDGSEMTLPADAPILWLPADANHPELTDALAAMDVGLSSIHLNTTVDDLYAGTELDASTVRQLLDLRIQHWKPALVVVDTVGSATVRDLCKQEDANRLFKPLRDMALKHGTTILCLAHLNAQGTAYGRRMEAHCRQVWKLTKPDPDQEDRRRLEVVKSNAKHPPPLGVTMGDRGNDYDDDPPEEEATAGKVAEKVREAMEWLKERLKDGPAQVYSLRDEWETAGFATGSIYRAKGRLGIEETTEEGGRGRPRKVWTLPTDDEEQAA
jgi:primase-polymerase (primpol)-like protein